MLKISEYSSLNFRSDWKGRTNIDMDYCQRFLLADPIKVQFICDPMSYDQLSVRLYNYSTGVTQAIAHSDLTPDQNYRTGQFQLPPLLPAQYELTIQVNSEIRAYSVFCVVETFEDSVLFRYTNYRTEQETIFQGDFCFRVEGIVLPEDVNFEVSTEDFRDQRYGLTQLSAFPYEKHTLTVGLGQGVPNWVGRKLNAIFSCSDIRIDGREYVRSEGSAPQKEVLQQDNPLYKWTIEVEPGETVEETGGHFETMPSSFDFVKEGGSETLTIVTDQIVSRVSVAYPWITLTKISDFQYRVEVAENTGDARRGEIFIVAGNKTHYIEVKQEAAEQEYFTTEPNPMVFNKAAGYQYLRVSTTYEVLGVLANVDWITIIEQTEGRQYQVQVTANAGTADRTGVITIQTSNGDYQSEVVQYVGPFISMTPTRAYFTGESNGQQFSINTNLVIASWALKDSQGNVPDWLSVIREAEMQFVVYATTNKTGQSRSATFTVTTTTGESVTATIDQLGAFLIGYEPSPVRFDTNMGGSMEVRIVSQYPISDWEYNGGNGIDVIFLEDRGLIGILYTWAFTVIAQPNFSARDVSSYFMAYNERGGSTSVNITVPAAEPYIALYPETATFFGAGGTLPVTVSRNVQPFDRPVVTQPGVSWARITVVDNLTLNVEADPNPGAAREATYEVTANGMTIEGTISQASVDDEAITFTGTVTETTGSGLPVTGIEIQVWHGATEASAEYIGMAYVDQFRHYSFEWVANESIYAQSSKPNFYFKPIARGTQQTTTLTKPSFNEAIGSGITQNINVQLTW